MSGFLERILSGQYPKLESIWRAEFDKVVSEVFGNANHYLDDEVGSLEDEFEEADTALLADLDRLEAQLAEERARHESVKRELGVVKAELKSARYKLDAIQHALDRAGSRLHGEPLG